MFVICITPLGLFFSEKVGTAEKKIKSRTHTGAL